MYMEHVKRDITPLPVPAHDKKTAYLLSDSSGNLLEHFFSAILTQFPKDRLVIREIPFLKDETAVTEIITKIRDGIVFHTVTSQKLKHLIADLCAQQKLPCWDVTGPTADFLEKAAGIRPYSPPRPLHDIDEKYMSRIKALEFAMQHDDSRRIEQLDQAEIILIGISRVSKSPTSLFLAHRGFLVANVSFVPGMPLQGCLGKHSHSNIVALTMRPKNLAEIRQRRFAEWKIKDFSYQNLEEVTAEVMKAEQIYKHKGWPIIDTTHLVVEETSSLILSTLKLGPKVF